jgi:fluoride exporter
MLSWRLPIAISLGAIAGALSRYYLNLWFVRHYGTSFPYGIFVINMTGCLGMGLIATLMSERVVSLSPEVYSLLTTGFLGAYTTFSTYGLDTAILIRNQEINLGLIYWLGSAIGGIVSVQLGIIIAHWFRS